MTDLLAGLKLFIAFEKELRKMNNAIKQTDTKFCIKFHTHNYSITGFFTGYYTYRGDKYLGGNDDINNEKVKWFKNLKLLKDKVEGMFIEHGFVNFSDEIYIYNERNQPILSFNGIVWHNL